MTMDCSPNEEPVRSRTAASACRRPSVSDAMQLLYKHSIHFHGRQERLGCDASVRHFQPIPHVSCARGQHLGPVWQVLRLRCIPGIVDCFGVAFVCFRCGSRVEFVFFQCGNPHACCGELALSIQCHCVVQQVVGNCPHITSKTMVSMSCITNSVAVCVAQICCTRS